MKDLILEKHPNASSMVMANNLTRLISKKLDLDIQDEETLHKFLLSLRSRAVLETTNSIKNRITMLDNDAKYWLGKEF